MAQSYGYLARIGVDTSGLQTGLREVDAQIRATETEINQINRALRQAEQAGTDSTQIQAQRVQVLRQQYEQLTSRLERLRSVSEQMERGLQNETINPEAYRSWQREINNTTARLQQLERQLNDVGDAENNVEGNSQNIFGDLLKADIVSKGIDLVANTLKNCADEIVNLCKESANLSAQWEQLEGGVETLFGAFDSQTVIENSKRAYETAGMSANEYMNMAVNSSTKLKKVLNDDTKAVAEYVDKQAVQISDIVNKLGVDMGMVSYAYQGFTRDNFTMLDNLALGYAGTKAGMQELLDDAGKLSGLTYDIKNYADILDAIQVIIEKQGIAGTTEIESLTTLEGAMKRFENQITNIKTELGNDFRPLLTEFYNIINEHMPEIQTMAEELGEEVSDVLTLLMDELKKFIDNGGLEDIRNTVSWLIDNLGSAISFLINHKDELLKLFTGFMIVLKEEEIIKFGTAVLGAVDKIKQMGAAFKSAEAFATTFGASLTAAMPIIAAAAVAVLALSAAFDSLTESMREATAEHNKYVEEYKKGLDNSDLKEFGIFEDENGKRVKGRNYDPKRGLEETKKRLDEEKEQLKQLELQFKTYKMLEYDLADGVIDSKGWNQERAQKYLDEHSNIAFELSYMKSSIAELEGLEKDFERQAAQVDNDVIHKPDKIKSDQNNKEIIQQIKENRRKQTEEEMAAQKSELNRHKITEDEYWAKRKLYLENHRDEESEEWWKYYDEVTKHYEKLSEEERKAADKALKEQEALYKEGIKKRYEALERQRDELEDDEYDEGWFIEQLTQLVGELEEGSDLYYEYYDKLNDYQKKVNAQIAKDAKSEADSWNKAADKVADAVKDKYKKVEKEFEKAKNELMGSLDLMSELDKKEEESAYALRGLVEPIYTAEEQAAMGKKKNAEIQLNSLKDQTKELKEYQRNLEALKNSGISPEHLADIMGMSFDERTKYIDALMDMSEKERKRYYAEYEEYSKLASEIASDTVEDDLKEAEAFEKSAENMLTQTYNDLSEEAKKQGKSTAQAWIDGWKEVMGDTNTLLTQGAVPSVQKTNGQIAYEAAQTYANAIGGTAVMQGNTIVINIDGKEYYRKQITDYNNDITLGGGIVGG